MQARQRPSACRPPAPANAPGMPLGLAPLLPTGPGSLVTTSMAQSGVMTRSPASLGASQWPPLTWAPGTRSTAEKPPLPRLTDGRQNHGGGEVGLGGDPSLITDAHNAKGLLEPPAPLCSPITSGLG